MKDTPRERSRILINAGANAVHMAAAVAVTLVVTPILVHGLGDTRYGMWMFVNSIVAYLGLGNLGVGQAVVRYVAKYDALDDHERVNRVFNTATAFFGCMGAAICVAALLVSYYWEHPAGASAELAGDARWLIAWLGCTLGAGMMLVASKGVIVGLRQYPALRTISVGSLLLRNALLVAAVWRGGGLKAVGAVLFGVSALDALCAVWVARRLAPQLRFSPRHVDWETGRTIGGYSLQVFAGTIAMMVIGQTAVVVIGAFLDPERVTHFSIASSLPNQAVMAFAAVIVVLTPSVSRWEAVGDHSAIRSLLIDATRYTMYLGAPVELGLLVLGAPFLALWMGPPHAGKSYVTLVALSVPLFLAVSQLTAARILEGVGKVRALAIVTIGQAVATVVLSVALVRPFGIEGVAWGSSLALGAAALAVIGVLCGWLQLSPVTILRRSFLGPMLASAVPGAVWVLSQRWLRPDGWSTFFAIGLLGMVPYAILVLAMEPRLRQVVVAGVAKSTGCFLARWQGRAGGMERDRALVEGAEEESVEAASALADIEGGVRL